MNRFRDWLACRIANFALNYIATRRYRDTIGGAISYGLRGAARDEVEGREPPPIVTYPAPGDHRGRTTSP